MAQAQLAAVVRHIHRLAGQPAEQDLSDAELLRRFLAERDDAAFGGLVERHGRLVFGVCRQVLRQRQDAEDAFQATFLVLAKRADSIRKGSALASWLYGTAYRVASNARRAAGRRRRYERRAGRAAQAAPDLRLAWQELQAVLAEEVERLPEKYRAPFVLCCLDGKSKGEAAALLGWKEGTVSGRLAEARKRLQRRLALRGLTLAGALTAGALAAGDAAAVPPALVQATIRVVRDRAAGSTRAAALAAGATQAMCANKVRRAAILVLALGLTAAAVGVGVQIHQGRAAPPAAEAPAPAGGEDRAKGAAPAKAPADAEDKIVVSGRVLDPDGAPLSGAEIVLDVPDWGETAKAARTVRARSGADGRFRFTVGRSQLPEHTNLVAVAEGYGPDWVEAAALRKGDVTLRLVKDVPINGRIRDLEARPVRGATIRVLRLEATADGSLTPVLNTWSPDSNRPSYLFTRHLLRPAWAGIPAAVTTDGEGRFRIRGAGGERMVVLKVEGPTIEHKVLHVLTRAGLDGKVLTRPDPDKMRPMPGRPTPCTAYGPTFDHLGRPTKPVLGVVRDRTTGKPLAGVRIFGWGANAWWEDEASTLTDEQGRYRLIGMPKGPRYQVRAAAGMAKPYLPAQKPLADSEGLAPLTAEFELVRGVRVHGRVTDRATGKPVRAALWYFPLADNKHIDGIPGSDFYKSGSVGMTTGRDGTYSLLVLPGAGVLKFRAEVGDMNPYTQVWLDPAHRKRAYADKEDGLGPSFLSAGGTIETLLGHNGYRLIEPEPGAEEVTCDVAFDRGETRTVAVVGPDGKPLAGATVYGLTALGGRATLKGDSFTAVALVPERPRTVTLVHPGRKLAGHIPLCGDEARPVTVRLEPWCILMGRLLDEEGKPLAGARVGLSYAEESARGLTEHSLHDRRRAITTDAAGGFRLEGVFPGMQFGLVFSKGGHFRDIGRAYDKMSLRPGETRDVGAIPSKVYGPD